jgi:ribonuclease D
VSGPLPRWIRSPDDLRALAAYLRGSSAVALDTEADSLHHYPERLCLIQVADQAGAAHLVDPLVLADFTPLCAVFADPAVLTVVHAGDNDLAALKRRFGFSFGAVFDTSIAARFLGVRALGLDALVEQSLGVMLGPSRQKDDWSARPLTEAQERYALDDVRYLIALADRLRAELRAVGREGWVLEECEALARRTPADKIESPDAYLDIKNARALPPRALAALRELYGLREVLARALDRPPFKVLGNETLRELATARPRDTADLHKVPGCTSRVVARHGDAILAAVARAEALPDDALPIIPRHPRPVVPAPVRARSEALRAWRSAAALRLGLDPGVLLPGRLIDRIAEVAPTDLDELARVERLGQWRVRELGGEILAAIASAEAGAGIPTSAQS